MTCQQYVITHLLDASDLSQILPTAMVASNKRTSFCSHLSTVVPRSSHTVFHVLDDALQRHRAPLVIRAHILKRISSSTLSYPGDFLFAREPQTSASLAKRRRTYRNIFCPVSARDGALLRCMIREFLRVHKAFDKIRNASLHLRPGRGAAACQEGSHVTRLQEVLNVMDENQKAFTGRCDRTGLHLPQRHVHINRSAVRSCPRLRSARTRGNGAMKW